MILPPHIDVTDIQWMKRVENTDEPLSINDTYVVNKKGDHKDTEHWFSVLKYPGLHNLYKSLKKSRRR